MGTALFILAMVAFVLFVNFGMKRWLPEPRPVGYCKSDEDCAPGYECINNRCVKKT